MREQKSFNRFTSQPDAFNHHWIRNERFGRHSTNPDSMRHLDHLEYHLRFAQQGSSVMVLDGQFRLRALMNVI